jgi:NADH:ubiquinone oxidoreductase subunit 4 (subunit M)
MNLFENNLLSLILWAPALVAAIVLLMPRSKVKLIRWIAFLGSLLPLGLSIVLWFRYDAAEAGFLSNSWSGWSGMRP